MNYAVGLKDMKMKETPFRWLNSTTNQSDYEWSAAKQMNFHRNAAILFAPVLVYLTGGSTFHIWIGSCSERDWGTRLRWQSGSQQRIWIPCRNWFRSLPGISLNSLCLLIYMKLTAHIITAFLPVSTKSLKRAKEKKNRYKEVNICNTGRVFSNQTSLPVLYCLYFNKLVLVV